MSNAGLEIRRRTFVVDPGDQQADDDPATRCEDELHSHLQRRDGAGQRRECARSAVNAVASLTRLSPSKTWNDAAGILTRRDRGGCDRIRRCNHRPRANPAASGGPAEATRRLPTTRVEKMTSPTDSEAMLFRLARKSTNEVLTAAEYRSGGRMPTRMISGSIGNCRRCPPATPRCRRRSAEVERTVGTCSPPRTPPPPSGRRQRRMRRSPRSNLGSETLTAGDYLAKTTAVSGPCRPFP